VRVDPETFIAEPLKKEIISKLTILLEEKHLYQNLGLDLRMIDSSISKTKGEPAPPSSISSCGGRIPGTPLTQSAATQILHRNLNSYKADFLDKYWEFGTESTPLSSSGGIGSNTLKKPIEFRFYLPTIKISCKHCDSILPAHNSGYKNLGHNLPELNFKKAAKGISIPVQIFFFPYQCQSCKGEPIIFIVRREGTKLQLVGRTHFEEVEVPKFLPAEESNYYSDAVVSFNCGKTLAALFYMRTMLEQYFRRILDERGRATGDELANRYAKRLPDEFPGNFKTLGKVYEELSIHIHAAKKDEEQFNTSRGDIQKHFDLLQHFTLKEPAEIEEDIESESSTAEG